jgi:predicted RNA methylase
MKNLFLILTVLSMVSNVYADIKTDKNAGICYAHMMFLKKNVRLADKAIAMADNPTRASEFANNWLLNLQKTKDFKVAAGDAFWACREFGINSTE